MEQNTNIEDLPGEEWKDIPGLEGKYQVSTHGRVKSLDRMIWSVYNKAYQKLTGRIIKFRTDRLGYKMLSLKCPKFQIGVHRLVMKVFVPNTYKKPCVNHIDNNPSNNHISNLEWCTYKENTQHSVKQNRRYLPTGGDHHNSVPINCYRKDGTFVKRYAAVSLTAADGFTRPNVTHVLKGKRKSCKGHYFTYADQ